MKLSIILDFNKNFKEENLINKLKNKISETTDKYEILFSDNNLKDKIFKAKGEFIITLGKNMPKDLSFISALWKNRNDADIIILSCINNFSKISKYFLINKISSLTLNLPVRDVHSKIRMYNSKIFKNINLDDKTDLQLQILVKGCFDGYKIKEINSNNRRCNLQIDKYAQSLRLLRDIRRSVNSADYDDRAYYSKFPLQGSWHKKRYKIIMNFLDDKKNILDLGCGSSKIIQDLEDAVGFDLAINKLRFVKNKDKSKLLVKGDATKLPFKDSSFKTIICSEIIEHIKDGDKLLNEIHRVLKEEGILILGTPDYNKKTWRILESVHNLFFMDLDHVHISKYNLKSLSKLLNKKGFKIIGYKYIFNSELIIKARKISKQER